MAVGIPGHLAGDVCDTHFRCLFILRGRGGCECVCSRTARSNLY